MSGSNLLAAAFGAAFLFSLGSTAGASPFQFQEDTLAFANTTVFAYENGHPHLRREEPAQPRPYTKRCFVMSRTVMQFRKFARFEPHGAPLDDRLLAQRVRAIVRRAAFREPLPNEARIVIPGYPNLRAFSQARPQVLQENIGRGWPTYWRPGNYRMFYQHSRAYQAKTEATLEATLAGGNLFVAYLSTFPAFSINHAVLIYAQDGRSPGGVRQYLAYDPNHPDAPRQLWWSERESAFGFAKDWDFVGGFVRVYQVYGKPLQ